MPGPNYKGTSKYQKLTEAMIKRTHFTETEIDRLADLHAKLMVKIVEFPTVLRSMSFLKNEGKEDETLKCFGAFVNSG